MNRSSKIVIKVVVLASTGIAIFSLISFLWNGKISVVASSPKSDFEVIVGDYTIKPGTSQKLRPGKYNVTVRGKRINSTQKNINVGPLGTVNITNDQAEMTDLQLVSTISGLKTSEFVLEKVTYFENANWLVAIASLTEDPLTSTPVIAQYQLGKWTVVDDGTGIEIGPDNGLPASVNKYLSGDSN